MSAAVEKKLDTAITKLNESGINIIKKDLDVIVSDVFEKFCREILSGSYEEMTHAGDPEWDCSGSLSRQYISPEDYLVKVCEEYPTLGSWAEQTYTGNSTATYMSGCGLNYETYSSEILEDVESYVFKLIKEKLGIASDSEDDDERVDDLYNNSLIYDLVASVLGYCL